MMNYQDWSASKNAPAMLTSLHLNYPDQMQSLIPQLHRYFIATCQRIEHLTPQDNLRKAVQGAEQWLAGEISDEALHRLEWNAEASAFRMERAKHPEDFEWLKAMVGKIEALKGLPIKEAHRILTNAAYFVDEAVCYPTISSAPFVQSLCLSEFLSADLLRKYLDPLLEDWWNIE